MKAINHLLLLILLCMELNLHAQSKSIFIQGYVDPIPGKPDTIGIMLWKDIIAANIETIQMRCATDRNGFFHFILPAIDHPARFSLELVNVRMRNSFSPQNIVEPGDHIQIHISKSSQNVSYRFTGSRTGKYECRQTLDSVGEKIDYVIEQEKKKPGFYETTYSLRRQQLEDSVLAVKYLILDRYKSKLSPVVYQLMKADITGSIRIDFECLFFRTPSYLSDSIRKERQIQYYRAILTLAVDTNSIWAQSPAYLQFLFYRSLIDLYVQSDGNPAYIESNIFTEGFKALYVKLKGDYQGDLRERLIFHYLTNMLVANTNGDFDECLQDAYKWIQNPALKKVLARWVGRKMKGEQVYNFSLPDTAGNMVSLSNLRGKLVFIDIWFTRCSGCRSFSLEMDSVVYPVFRNDSNILFVSISMDEDKQVWLKSVREEIYSLKSFINLYTNGMGIEHPFLRYYDVQGGPTLMLVDRKGRIYSSTIPRQGRELISLINEALRESDD